MAEEKIFQVSEFNEFVNAYLGKVGEVVIEGEITTCNVSGGKWLFITIKDKESSVEVFGVTFQISGYSVLEPGMLVHVYGIPRLYQKTGKFSVYASQIVPAGEGALRLAFEKLKEKLEKEGLFTEERKRKITEFPERIGLITAKDSRAYGDFVKVLKHRMGGMEIFLYPVNVQGKASVKSIIRAFDYFNKNLPTLDALVLVRGGGSLEDLQSFNDEELARAIFSSKVPVVSGVGHEDDLTIADLVSDLRASTPSNAAELLVKNKTEILSQVYRNVRVINAGMENIMSENNNRIQKNIRSLENAISSQVSSVRSTIAKFSNNFVLLSREIINKKAILLSFGKRLSKGTDNWIKRQWDRINNLDRLISSFDVGKTMKRGFSITYDSKGKILKTIKSLDKGSHIATDLFDGKICAQVITVSKK